MKIHKLILFLLVLKYNCIAQDAEGEGDPPPDAPESPPEDVPSPPDESNPPPDGAPESASGNDGIGINSRKAINSKESFELESGNSSSTEVTSDEAEVVTRLRGSYGGQSARAGVHPYHLQIIYDGQRGYCGATLIISPSSEKQIGVTAASCMYGKPIYKFKVQAGSNVLDDPHTQTLRVKNVVIHDLYERHLPGNDIAIILFDGQFTPDSSIRPLELAWQNQSLNGTVTLTGWRTTAKKYALGRPSVLQYITLSVLSNDKCEYAYRKVKKGKNNIIKEKDLCIRDLKNPKGSCVGDVGAPVTWTDTSGREFLAGVVSFQSSGCNSKYLPVVFPKVSHYVDWIGKASSETNLGKDDFDYYNYDTPISFYSMYF